MQCVVEAAAENPATSDPWSSAAWNSAKIIPIENFHPRSSDHRPITHCKVLHHLDELHVAFRVQDRYVRCLRSNYQDMVSKDSCVEFFLEPRAGRGYFNFEINCGGAMLLYFIEDPTPALPAFFRKFTPVPFAVAAQIKINTSLPSRVEPEITDPVTWTVQCAVPISVFSHFLGEIGPLAGQEWRGNFFKCGDETSHPHWASWACIGERLRFHQPEYFKPIFFAAP
jgi:hypothetical protein